jgi:hypothetical protein
LQFPDVDGIAVPGLEAIVGPPTVGQPKGPQVYIKVASFREKRESSPPGSGTKRIEYQVDLMVRWTLVTGSLQSNAIIMFSSVLDGILTTLRQQPKSILLEDPITGAISQLGLLGEAQSGSIVGPFATADQRMQLYGAPLKVNAVERQMG